MEIAFGKFHPAINMFFFAGAIFFGMFFTHPVFLSIALFASVLTYCLMKKEGKTKFFMLIIILTISISIINPLFNTRGEHVLFTYFNGRAYTLESLEYGFFYGCLFASVLVWFACYNIVMTEDKFTYLFGRTIPSLSLLLTMVLRLIPIFRRRITTTSNAQNCIGTDTKMKRSMNVLIAVMSESLENSVHTTDSMKSRGYGCGKRTSYFSYKKQTRDKLVGCFMAACVIIIVIGTVFGNTSVEFFPVVRIPEPNVFTIAGIAAYAAFLLIPAVIHFQEEISWHISRSKI